ncbi:MAG: hypothetical protein IPK33_22060 [Gemmatimonadetes bacterium]|nr:hypothetical protein [Gemmatimonadota bacterium]
MTSTVAASQGEFLGVLAAVSQLFDATPGNPPVPSWRGFLDIAFLLSSLGSLLLATGLGALIAFHPTTLRTVDTFEEAELPKVYIMYAVVGAVIGVTVLRYGMVVGVVVFGIGGLIRFRTDTGSTRDTGRLIVVTLVGLTTGLGLPHFAVLTALFAFALIYVLDSRPICRVVIKELPDGRVAEAAAAYRSLLKQEGCAILSERKAFTKQHVSFVFRAPRKGSLENLQGRLATRVAEEVRGELDWELE